MKGGARIAIGVGIGYVLGRTRKMRFALALAGAAMSRRSAGVSGELLEQGTSLLKSSPELAQITDTVKGELLGAVRSAAVTAASNRIDALNARLQQRAVPDSQVGGESQERDSDEDERPEDELAEEEPAEEEAAEDAEDAADEYDEDDSDRTRDEDAEDAADEYDEDDSDRTRDEEAEPTSTRPQARRTRTTMRRTGSRTSDRSTGSAERKTPSARRRRTRVDTDEADEAPVRRTRR
ncbi:hypothetical protein ACIBG0_05660 [Nocardia sp. NPDC050630]|uniref:hypothetical protein n=1 Tax=Nocardia sp. NPDC050630 TaxID=3364321 RepID=UPI003796BA74